MTKTSLSALADTKREHVVCPKKFGVALDCKACASKSLTPKVACPEALEKGIILSC
jgi:hypothetical protein